MGRKRHARLFFITLSFLVALIATVSCGGAAPTPAPTIPPPPVATPTPSTPTMPKEIPAPVLPTPTPTAPWAVPVAPAPAAAITLEIREPQDESILSRSPVRVSGITTLDAIVSVNGNIVIVEVGDDGAFNTTVSLLEGPNLLEITASDYEGKQASRIITVIYLP